MIDVEVVVHIAANIISSSEVFLRTEWSSVK